MSKKSRKRNKRLLMLAALAGGAAFLGRGKGIGTKETISDAQKAHNFAANAAAKDSAVPDTSGSFITKKDKEQKIDPGFQSKYKKKVDGRWMGPGEIRIAAAKERKYETGEHYTPNLDPYKIPTPRVHKRMVNQGTTLRAKGGRIGAQKGGSVTGIAKRGFGRALKKK